MRRLVIPLVLAVAAPARLAAQDPSTAQVPCQGQVISDIQVATRPPLHGKQGRWWDLPVRWAGRLHVNTDPDVIRRFLLLEVGEQCRERERFESERILRTQRFIAGASVRTYPDGEGGVIVVVETVDEFTPIFSLKAGGDDPFIRRLALGDGNIAGSGRYLRLEWRDGVDRDGYGVRLIDPQFLGRSYVLELLAARYERSQHRLEVEVANPFYTDLQRTAWRVRYRDQDGLFDFYRGSAEPVRLRLDRDFVDVGGVIRIGQPGRLSLFGVSLSRERDVPGLPVELDSAVDYGSLLARYTTRNNARINLLWGVRNIEFRRVRRFDALNAEQDVPAGFQLGTLLGRGVSALGTTDDDVLLGADLYAGVGSARTFGMLQARGEGRHNFDVGEWDGIIASATATLYHRLADRHTLVLEGEVAGSWRQRVPLQLTLGDRHGGVRGFEGDRDAGARRAIVRAEERWFLPPGLFEHADLGLGAFVDAGVVRRGDAPFGMDTPVKVGAGVSLFGAAPRGSQRTWRLDLAVPVTGGSPRGWEVRLSVIGDSRLLFREPEDLQRGREQSVPVSLYNWP